MKQIKSSRWEYERFFSTFCWFFAMTFQGIDSLLCYQIM